MHSSENRSVVPKWTNKLNVLLKVNLATQMFSKKAKQFPPF